MENINKFQKLVDDFNALKLKDRDESPTFLDIAKCPRWENVWSNILAFYIDPNKNHQLGAFLLQSIFQSIAVPLTEVPITENITVGREYATKKGNRIDLVVTGEHFVLGIENKVDAELYNDLADYSAAIDALAKGKTAYKIVLSKYPQPATDGFVSLLYRDLLKTIKQNIGAYTSFADTKYFIFLLDFLKNIENNINNNIMSDNPELRNFVDKNLTAIKAIVEVYNAHLRRPHEINVLLNNKTGRIGTYWKDENGVPVLFYKLDNRATSDSFEIDFYDTHIEAYSTNSQLKEYAYTASDEEIAEGLKAQMDAILSAIQNGNTES
jgi:hypothetical protein